MKRKSKERARALQILYAWELRHGPPVGQLTGGMMRLTGGRDCGWSAGEELARKVLDDLTELDAGLELATEHWRPERVGIVERNILRIALWEIRSGLTPPRVAIDEAVNLAHRFAGGKAPGFVNGVLDAVARSESHL